MPPAATNVLAGGVEVVQHVERGQAAGRRRRPPGPVGAGVARRWRRRRAVVGDLGGRLELPDAVAVLEHDRARGRSPARRPATGFVLRQPRQRRCPGCAAEQEVDAGAVVEGDRPGGVVGGRPRRSPRCPARRRRRSAAISGVSPAARPISAYWLVDVVVGDREVRRWGRAARPRAPRGRPRWPGSAIGERGDRRGGRRPGR